MPMTDAEVEFLVNYNQAIELHGGGDTHQRVSAGNIVVLGEEVLRLRELIRKVTKRGPPLSDMEDSSLQRYACCGSVETRPHAKDCWWVSLCDNMLR